MMFRYDQLVSERVFKVEIHREDEVELKEEEDQDLVMTHGEIATEEKKQKPIKRNVPKVGRNDPCPCGSGKKFKKCHGKEVLSA